MYHFGSPPFCPYPRCRYHTTVHQGACFSVRYGTYRTAAGHRIRRYRCCGCRRTFSDRSFSIDYFTHLRVDYRRLVGLLCSCVGVCAAGRLLGVSPQTVLNRISRIARGAAAEQDLLLAVLPLREHLALDGFVSFCQSQYHPCEISVLVGARSQLLYRWEYTLSRRRGRMSEGQRRERERRDRLFSAGPHPVRTAVVNLGADAYQLLFGEKALRPLRLDSDEHPAYPQALRRLPLAAWRLWTGDLHHRTTPSSAPRTVRNPLFPVNYLEREIRTRIAEHVRESTRFGRNVNNQCERFALFQLAHNYLRPHRAHGSARLATHAEVAGIPPASVGPMLGRIFCRRFFPSRARLSASTVALWERSRATPFKGGVERVPAYVWG